MKKINLALAGGGLKSFSQVALIQDIENKGHEIVSVSGISMGSVVAALYACGLNGRELEMALLSLEKTVEKQNIFRKINISALNPFDNKMDGFVNSKELEKVLKDKFEEYGVTMISDCKLPICIGATDVATGELNLFTNKPKKFKTDIPHSKFYDQDVELSKAVIASCGFPFVLSSTEIGGIKFIDGGVVCNVLTTVFETGFNEIVLAGCSLMIDKDFKGKQPHELGIRSLQLMIVNNELIYQAQADISINFEIDFSYLFNIGKGNDVISLAKAQLIKNPLNYNVKKGLFF